MQFKAQILRTCFNACQLAASSQLPLNCSFGTTTCSIDLNLTTEFKDTYRHNYSLQIPWRLLILLKETAKTCGTVEASSLEVKSCFRLCLSDLLSAHGIAQCIKELYTTAVLSPFDAPHDGHSPRLVILHHFYWQQNLCAVANPLQPPLPMPESLPAPPHTMGLNPQTHLPWP